MGQNISHTSPFQEYMDNLGIDNFDVGFIHDEDDDDSEDEEDEDSSESEDADDDSEDEDSSMSEDDDDNEDEENEDEEDSSESEDDSNESEDDEDEDQERHGQSVYLTVPVDESLLNNYTLNDLDQLADDYLVWVTSESFVCIHEFQYFLQFGYPVIEILIYFTDDNKAPKRYQINASDHEEAEVIINGILYLMNRTLDFKNCKTILINAQQEENDDILDQPFTINQENFHVILNRFDNNINNHDEDSILAFRGITLNTEQTTVLSSSNYFPDNVMLGLYNTYFNNNDNCHNIFANGLANNKGPTRLLIDRHYNTSNTSLCIKICNALSDGKNTRLNELRLHFGLDGEAYTALCNMLQTNTGIVTLSVYLDVSNKGLIFQSLYSHPTLKHLKIKLFLVDPNTTTTKARKHATELIIDMLKSNHIIQEIEFDQQQQKEIYDDRVLQTEVYPRLQINKKRQYIQQINNEANEETKSNLIGNFIIKNQHSLSLIWLIIRDNNYLLTIDKIRKALF